MLFRRLIIVWVYVVLATGGLGLALPAATKAMPETSEPAPQPCAHLEAGSSKWKRCRERNGLPAASATQRSDEALVLGYALAKDGKFDEALKFLRTVENEGDPRVLTYIGFAERRLGRIDVAMDYYRRALKIDPENVATLEYLGEAHLQQGDLAAAKTTLAEIAKLCGEACEAHAVLAKAIADYPNRHTPSVDKLKR